MAKLIALCSRPWRFACLVSLIWFFVFYYGASRFPAQFSYLPIQQWRGARGRHLRIAKVTVAANELANPIIDRALHTHQVHNNIHGYEQFVGSNQVVDNLVEKTDAKNRPEGAWTKPAYIFSILVAELEKPEDERLDWLFWFDADIVVLNPETPLEIFLPPDPELADIHLIMASNWDGLNSGAFALRVNKWSSSLISAVLSYPIYKADIHENDPFRDQSAFQWLLEDPKSPLAPSREGGRQPWTVVPMRWFNSLPINNPFEINDNNAWVLAQNMTGTLFDNGTAEVHDDGHGPKVQPWKVMQGDMMVHFAGATEGGNRDSWMGPWLDRAEKRLPEWSNKTTKVSLAREADEFWANVVNGVKLT